MDTVSFNDKHNMANGENNRDGHSDNHVRQHGRRGYHRRCRHRTRPAPRRRRNMMLTLMLSQGVPMIVGGDEVGNSQGGNNNAYCQDNTVGWTDLVRPRGPVSRFLPARSLPSARRIRCCARNASMTGDTTEDGRAEIAWFKPDGNQMDDSAWDDGELRVLGVYIGKSVHASDSETLDDLFMVFNAGGDCEFQLPELGEGELWYPRRRHRHRRELHGSCHRQHGHGLCRQRCGLLAESRTN